MSPFSPATNPTAIPALGALIPNTSCATDLPHAGLYLLSAQLVAGFAPAAWLGTISIAAAVKAGSCSEGSHNSDDPTLLC